MGGTGLEAPCKQAPLALQRGAEGGAPRTRLAVCELCPGEVIPGRWPLSAEPLDVRIRLFWVGRLLGHGCSVPRRELGHGIPHLRAGSCTRHQDHARPVARAHKDVLRPGGRVEEVPRPEPSLLALDEQRGLPRQNEEGLLVIDAALARLQDGEVDSELIELDLRVAVLALEVACRASAVREPPLGIAHIHDEPALGGGSEP
jgi:hypothetical protein